METPTALVIKYDGSRRMTDFKEIPYTVLDIAEHLLNGYEVFPEEYAGGLRRDLRELAKRDAEER